MLAPSPVKLNHNSTLIDIESHNFQVDAEVFGKVINEKFQNQPELPGVIIISSSQGVRMLSRRKFVAQMSQPYSLELYLKRPIQILLNLVTSNFLQLPYTCTIEQAVKIALNRPTELVYDPIVVVKEEQLSLVDIHTLLLAQTQMLAESNILIELKHQQAQAYLAELETEKEKVKQYTVTLEAQYLKNEQRNQTLEAQQIDLQQQSQKINGLNQQFIRISQLLSVEVKKSFQATFDNVNSICDNVEQIVSIDQDLVEEVKAVKKVTNLIEGVSKQVWNLATQASLIASQFGEKQSVFTQITEQINNLEGKTHDASAQANQIANRFQSRIQELTKVAREGQTTALSLIQENQVAQSALMELEQLVNQSTMGNW